MASSLGSLVIELAANTAQFQSDMGKAFDSTKRGLENFKKALGAIGLAVGLNEIKNIGLEAIRMGDELQKASVKTGIGARAISELAYAARQSDIDLESLSTSLTKMQIAVSKAGSGAEGSNEAFRALGLSIADIRKLQPEDQFAAIAEQISKLRDPADKARASVEIFGRAGANLLPLFSDGADGVRKLREEAIKFYQSFDENKIKKLSAADESIKKLNASFSGLATTITAAVAPSLTSFFDGINSLITGKWGSAGHGASGGWGDAITEAITKNAPSGFIDLDKILPEIKITAFKIHTDKMTELYDSLNESTKTFAESQADSYRRAGVALDELLKNRTVTPEEAKKRRDELLDSILPDINPDDFKKKLAKFKEGTDEMSDIATDAAQRIKGAFVEFFYQPFDGALKRLVATFIDALREMVARTAAARLFEAFGFGGGKSGVGGLASILGSFVGLADGGSFKVGGSGSTDSQLVAFRASPDETVHVTKPGQSVGGGTPVIIHNHIDLSGAFVDSKQALAAAVAQGAQRGVAQMTSLIRRGAFA